MNIQQQIPVVRKCMKVPLVHCWCAMLCDFDANMTNIVLPSHPLLRSPSHYAKAKRSTRNIFRSEISISQPE